MFCDFWRETERERGLRERDYIIVCFKSDFLSSQPMRKSDPMSKIGQFYDTV